MESIKKIGFINDGIRLHLENIWWVNIRLNCKSYPQAWLNNKLNVSSVKMVFEVKRWRLNLYEQIKI